MAVESPFNLRLLRGTEELEDTRLMRSYVNAGALEMIISWNTVDLVPAVKKRELGNYLQQSLPLWQLLSWYETSCSN